MLRQPNSIYQNGRSNFVVKYKIKRDAEALALEVTGNECICELPNKKTVTAKIENCVINLITSGDVVSYKCTILKANGEPKFPVIYKIRNDLTWENVIATYIHKRSIVKKISDVRPKLRKH